MHCLPCNSRSTWKFCKIWDEIWSYLALWDVDFGGSYFITKLFFPSHLPPIKNKKKPSIHPNLLRVREGTKQRKKERRNIIHFISHHPLSIFHFLFLPFPPCLRFQLCILISWSKMGMAAAESQYHVLAVDDSLIDRKLIERLLRTSSYQGNLLQTKKNVFFFFISFLILIHTLLSDLKMNYVFLFSQWQLLQLILVARL